MVELCTVSRVRNTSVADRAPSIAHWRPPNARLLSRTEGEDVVCERMCRDPRQPPRARNRPRAPTRTPPGTLWLPQAVGSPKAHSGAPKPVSAARRLPIPAKACGCVYGIVGGPNSAIHVEATLDPTRFVASTRCNDVNNTPFTRNLYRTAERKRAPLYERCGPWRSPQRSWLKGDTVKLKEGRFDG